MTQPSRRRFAALPALLLPALLLGACGQDPSPAGAAPPAAAAPAPQTPPARALGQVYELRFQNVGAQGQPTSSLTLVGGGRVSGDLGAQALTDVGDGQLGFALVATDTFSVGGVRHLRAVYRVTNNTGRALEHLTFVPVNTDEDGDPATVTSSAPTVGATYFKGLTTYGGTDASGRATALSAVTGKTLSAAQGAAVTDPEATPYTALDTSPLTPSAPSGLVIAGRAGAGWRLPTALAAGASANLTFAVDLQSDTPQTDPFNFSVVVAAGDDVNTAPTIAPAATSTPRLSLGAGTATVSGVLGDPTDPASTAGLGFTVGDRESAAGDLSVTAVSSDPGVATATLSGSGADRTLKIVPQGVGKATVTVTVSDGALSSRYVVDYAASKASGTPATSRFHTGESNASSAQALDADTMLVADDEFNALRLYSRSQSGLPLASFDFSSQLSLPDAANPELDLEASTRSGDRLYWLGSHSNSRTGKVRANRYRLFATDLSGSGAGATLSFVGHYDNLRADLIAWDNAGGHGLGAKYLGLDASAATGVVPEAEDGSGFNIEGLSFAPGSATTALLGFRAPNEPATARRAALIVPVTNFTALVTGTATKATFDPPVLLDLGGRGVRELKCNASGCLILAGPASGGGNFALYTWSGDRADPAQFRGDLSALAADSDGSLESLVDLPGGGLTTPAADGGSVQVLSDNGDTVYAGDGVIAKDAPALWQKFRSDVVTLGAAQTCTVNGVTVSPASASVAVGAQTTFTAAVSTSPAGCPVTVTYASTDTSVATVNPTTGVATGVAQGTAGITATASAGYGSAPVSSSPATLNVNAAPDYSLSLGNPSPATFTASAGGGASAALTLKASGGYSGAPTFTVASSPAGVTGSVSGSGGAFTVNLSVPAGLAPGSYSLSVTGTDGALSRTSNAVTVTVAAATAPNVVVYRVGDGSAALSSVGTAVFLDTFKTDTGALLRTLAMPTATSGTNRALVASGSATSEGLLTRSADGRYLLVPGYGAAVGTASVAGTAATAVPRVVGRVDAAGTVDTTTALTDAANSNNIRSAASPDGSALYVSGGAGGVRFAPLGGTTSTQLSTTVTNLRQVNVFGGQLYVSTGSGSAVRLGTVGSGAPTAPGQTITNLPGLPTSGSPFAFYFTKLGTGSAAVDTVYIADDAANTGIQKYSFDGSMWTARGAVGSASDQLRGLTGVTSGGSVTLFATSEKKLLSLTDASGFGGTLSGTPTTLATAGTNTAFRGVALAPQN
ncbi:beta strand repeat-containing protein [Deinococcus gobiensis]|uniref:BIG2 domain-containing protein n=1 Tax=Deinococcus gobiensis (strain DSM 21396 / JCM 16679 / CGMCC 1.7299 / I-0) TaxID=745776 RepID=H8GX31_DEIGI|nr:DUF3616 domain-containing protein [Deinococcus gobiensis]AFD24571.1 hypothetical protein DGo_CA0644 [Deinococcus gobiensis I-0]